MDLLIVVWNDFGNSGVVVCCIGFDVVDYVFGYFLEGLFVIGCGFNY